MGNKNGISSNKTEIKIDKIKVDKKKFKKKDTFQLDKTDLENIIWLDPEINTSENILYKGQILELDKFDILTYTKIEDCISKLKEIDFQKTYIIINGSISSEFFVELEKIIEVIKICPMIMIFSNLRNFNKIKKDIMSLNKFSFFNANLVFNNIQSMKKQLKIKEIYIPNLIEKEEEKEEDNRFSFEYIKDSKDLIFPLTFIEFMDTPSKFEIIDFNEYLLDKYSKFSKMNELISQLLIEVKIPFPILVKYWIRAYTLQTPFYYEMNKSLERNERNDYDTYIRVLYQGLLTKIITPSIESELYRGALINLAEIDKLKEALNSKRKDLPECICYNKAFLSSSLDEEVARGFMIKKKPKENEIRVLYIFEKVEKLDEENATNADIWELSYYKKEREILFFPFSCFEISDVKYKEMTIVDKNNKKNKFGYYEVHLCYLGKYRSKIDKTIKIPENDFTKTILSSNVLEKNEMNKKTNKNKFDFDINKYIPPNLKQSYIFATYRITIQDINKKIQIINHNENNKKEIATICEIYLNNKKIDFTFEYIFNSQGEYTFMFQFNDLLTNASSLFKNCKHLISINFSKFKSNYLNDMSNMFQGCSNLEILDLSNIKTKDVLNMKSVFKDCISLKEIDLSNFNTNKVIDMSEMFCGCNSLTFLNLSNFKTYNVNNMYRIFYKCSSLFFINLSSFESTKVKDIREMFSECSSLNALDLSNFEINNNINTEKMFYNCSYFKSLRNEFMSELSDLNIQNSIKKTSEEFLESQSQILSQDIQFYLKNKKYQNIEILNQSIEEVIKKIKKINILILGDSNTKSILIKSLYPINNIKNKTSFDIGCLKIYISEDSMNNINILINDLNKKGFDSAIHFIWICINSTKIKDEMKNVMNELKNKFQRKNNIYIIYLTNKVKEDIKKSFTKSDFEIVPLLLDNNNKLVSFDDITFKMKNNFNNILYEYIYKDLNFIEIIKKNIQNIEAQKDLDDIPNSISKYFEKLLRKREDINQYISKQLKNTLIYSKRAINTDTMTDYIDKFKQEKLKIKVIKTKKIDIENLDNELNKDLKKKYDEIAKIYYEKEFIEEFYNFFLDFCKKEAENIIKQMIKELNYDYLKPFIEKNLTLV